jgi:2-oxoglutarate ferredoxin oxidoreductase subunit beta
MKHMVDIIDQAIRHQGFSFVHVLSPCVTFMGKHQYDILREKTEFVPEQHDPANRGMALNLIESVDPIFLGCLYHQHYPTYEQKMAEYREKYATETDSLLDRYAVPRYEG